MSGELEALAARVEAATGPDREIDALIEAYRQRDRYPDATVVRMGKLWSAVACKGPGRGWRRYGIFFQHHAYSASLDAAMKLIEPTWFFHLARFSPEIDGRAQVHVYPNRYVGDDYEAEAATPALALTAASLRARASLAREPGEDRHG